MGPPAHFSFALAAPPGNDVVLPAAVVKVLVVGLSVVLDVLMAGEVEGGTAGEQRRTANSTRSE